MPRPIWKGAISFGLVTIPVDLYSAVEAREELSFNMLHKKDGSRIEMKRFCKEEQVEVPWSEIVKGYQYEKGQYVVMRDEAFVPATDIEDLYFDQPYYVGPSGKPGMRAYGLLREALRESGKIGVGTIVMRQREHLGALEPAGDILVLTTMRFAHEIRSPKDIDVPKRGETNPKEMKLAHELIDTLSAKWDPSEFQDTYTDVLRKAIEQKVEGQEIHRSPARAAATCRESNEGA